MSVLCKLAIHVPVVLHLVHIQRIQRLLKNVLLVLIWSPVSFVLHLMILKILARFDESLTHTVMINVICHRSHQSVKMVIWLLLVKIKEGQILLVKHSVRLEIKPWPSCHLIMFFGSLC